MELRRDHGAVRDVHRRAFGDHGPKVADLAEALRSAVLPVFAEQEGEVVGHVVTLPALPASDSQAAIDLSCCSSSSCCEDLWAITKLPDLGSLYVERIRPPMAFLFCTEPAPHVRSLVTW